MTRRAAGGDARRNLPSVDELLRHERAAPWVARWGREPTATAIRQTLAETRSRLGSGDAAPAPEDLLAETFRRLSTDRSSLRAVVNATGVILHTNLGRAPLSSEAARAAARVAMGYSSLEYDVGRGERGDRHGHCARLVERLTGAESALVVNNNAAAVSLAINTLARGRDVIVSRGELVEIGGGFRIPEVIERSGAFLVAVGSTNRTRLEDYRRAITPSTGLLLKIHPSNYRIQGFAEEASLPSLVDLGRASGVPVMHDLGSGLLLEGVVPGAYEPSVTESVESGADVVAWSGDKLLGGPQAGILHGRGTIVDKLRSNPLLRAYRVDKMTLAALEATLRIYLSPERARKEIPVLNMLSATAEEVESRARVALAGLGPSSSKRVTVVRMQSTLGGGTAPGLEIPSAGWALAGRAADLDSWMRNWETPIIGRIENGVFLLDFRTVFDTQHELLASAVEGVVSREDSSA